MEGSVKLSWHWTGAPGVSWNSSPSGVRRMPQRALSGRTSRYSERGRIRSVIGTGFGLAGQDGGSHVMLVHCSRSSQWLYWWEELQLSASPRLLLIASWASWEMILRSGTVLCSHWWYSVLGMRAVRGCVSSVPPGNPLTSCCPVGPTGIPSGSGILGSWAYIRLAIIRQHTNASRYKNQMHATGPVVNTVSIYNGSNKARMTDGNRVIAASAVLITQMWMDTPHTCTPSHCITASLVVIVQSYCTLDGFTTSKEMVFLLNKENLRIETHWITHQHVHEQLKQLLHEGVGNETYWGTNELHEACESQSKCLS